VNDADRPAEIIGTCEYLAAGFQTSDQLAILLRNPDSKEIIQRMTTAARITEPSFQQWLRFKNERAGFDVYIGMNPLKPNARTRTKEDILAIRHLYVDLDHEGPKALADIRLSELVPKPSYVLSTSPGKFQVIWRVEAITQEHAEKLLRAMARRFRADPAATDSTRVLRLPDFLNHKYQEKFTVTAQRLSDRVYGVHDFKLRIEYDDAPYQPPHRTPKRNRKGDLTQSEHDWAYASRALRRGDDPEEIIRAIAAYRSNDKPDPEYYARHTVEKAHAELKAEQAGAHASPDDRTDFSSMAGSTSRAAGYQKPR